MTPPATSHQPPATSHQPPATSHQPRTDRWDSSPVHRRVLAVVRTATALDRLLDVLPTYADDLRVATEFTVVSGSAFAADAPEHLRSLGARYVPWDQLIPSRYDLAISPSSNGALQNLRIPLLTLPHGAGFHKLRADFSGVADEVGGLAREQLISPRDGSVVPRIIGLPHESYRALLARESPEALPRAEVLGDPCFARLRASTAAREQYRSALGTGGRTLVTLASTWGPQCLFHQRGELAAELLAHLPPAKYQVALVLHPNVWSRYGELQLRQWTRWARRAGLLLIPQLRRWQPTLVASDVVVSDHGSLAYYAACLGKPLLLGAFGATEVVPGSPMRKLGDSTARWRSDLPARAQLDAAVPVPDHEELADSAFADRPSQRLRAAIYRELGLSEPSWQPAAEPVALFTPRR